MNRMTHLHRAARRVTLAASVVFMTTCIATTGVQAAELQLRAASFAPLDTTWGKPFQMFVDHVNEIGKGVLQIRAVGPEAIPATEQPNAVRSGLVDMISTPPGMYKSAMVEANAQDLSNMTLAEQRASGGYDALNAILKKRLNAQALTTFGTSVPFHIFLTKDNIKSEADLKGLRVRSQPIFSPLFESLGMSQSMIPIPEVYTALERGVVHGFGFAAWGLDDLGWDKLTKVRIDPGFYSVVVNVLINSNRLAKLTSEQRKVLDDSVTWFENMLLTYTKEVTEHNRAKQAAAGIKSVDFGPEFAKKARDLYWKELERLSPQNIPALRAKLDK